jgi:AcrR family transcriptional regulator
MFTRNVATTIQNSVHSTTPVTGSPKGSPLTATPVASVAGAGVSGASICGNTGTGPGNAAAAVDTRQRILEVAGEVFARLGFRSATVRDICSLAGANVAAINYHFGDKETLYREVLGASQRATRDRYPLTPSDPSAPAEVRLREFIARSVESMLDEGAPSWHGQLIAREMVEPSEALGEIAMEFIYPQYDTLSRIIRELLGPLAEGDEVRRCALSVMGQIAFYRLAGAMIDHVSPGKAECPATRADLAAHICEFSLRGIEAIRARIAIERAGEA